MNPRFLLISLLVLGALSACRSQVEGQSQPQESAQKESPEEKALPAKVVERWKHSIELLWHVKALRSDYGRVVALRQGACPVHIGLEAGELVELECAGEVSDLAQTKRAILVQEGRHLCSPLDQVSSLC